MPEPSVTHKISTARPTSGTPISASRVSNGRRLNSNASARCQIFIARKGGIAEEEGEFVLRNREFFLFPSYAHQSRDSLKPSVHLEFDLIQADEPADGKIHLRHFARVTDEIRVTHPEILGRLDSFHIWDRKLLEGRFEWGSEKALTIVVLRVYELPQEIRLPMRPEYGGCKSWVTTEDLLRVPPGLKPVLSDNEFQQRRNALLAQFSY